MPGVRRPPLGPTQKPRNPRGKPAKPYPQAGGTHDEEGLTRLVCEHLQALEVRGYSGETVAGRRRELGVFLTWCVERGLEVVTELDRRTLERYQHHLFHCRREDGKPLTTRSQHNLLRSVRVFFRWLVRTDRLPSNPAADLDMPKLPRQLPRDVLSEGEAEQILAQPDIKTPLGLRDRAILEVLYSTGVRRSELIGLDTCDVDYNRGVVMVREGKGHKDRVVPIGERAVAWVTKYIGETRSHYVFDRNEQALFLNYDGARLHRSYIGHVVRRYLEQAGVQKRGSCHMFRHTVATLMLENGADIRYIQAMLGHEKLETTQVYTHVAIGKLKDIHTQTHPARMHRSATADAVARSLLEDTVLGECNDGV